MYSIIQKARDGCHYTTRQHVGDEGAQGPPTRALNHAAPPFAAFGRERLTDESLDEGLRTCRRTHESGGSTSDLADALNAAAGGSLTTLPNDWLFTTGWRDPVCSAATTDAALAHWTRENQ